MTIPRLFHVSETAGIDVFLPRPSPSFFAGLEGEVVFAISEKLLHNYLLPRDCPRVCFYAGPQSTAADITRFLEGAPFVVVTENAWRKVIEQTTVYCYEFPTATFSLLDECAGYYVSHLPVKPLLVQPVADLPAALAARRVTLRFTDNLHAWADAIKNSSLLYSVIRLHNARGYDQFL